MVPIQEAKEVIKEVYSRKRILSSTCKIAVYQQKKSFKWPPSSRLYLPTETTIRNSKKSMWKKSSDRINAVSNLDHTSINTGSLTSNPHIDNIAPKPESVKKEENYSYTSRVLPIPVNRPRLLPPVSKTGPKATGDRVRVALKKV